MRFASRGPGVWRVLVIDQSVPDENCMFFHKDDNNSYPFDLRCSTNVLERKANTIQTILEGGKAHDRDTRSTAV